MDVAISASALTNCYDTILTLGSLEPQVYRNKILGYLKPSGGAELENYSPNGSMRKICPEDQ